MDRTRVFVAYPLIPVDRRHRGGLRARADLRLAGRAPAGVPAARRPAADAPRSSCLRGVNLYGDPSRWRHAGVVDHDGAVVPEHDQVAAVAAVPADDARPRAADAVRRGARYAALAPAGAGAREGAAVLLRAALHAAASARRRRGYARYRDAHWMFESPDLANYPFTPPPGWGYSLPVVYVDLDRRRASRCIRCADGSPRVKQRRRDAWLSYL